MPIAPDNSLGNLGSILGSIPGLSEAINGQTSTSSTSISNQGLNYLLQQILSGTGGLATVAGGQNTAGLYNSTVQQQSVNDLLTRSAGEVASKTATTTTQKQPTINLGQTLLQGGAGLVGSKLLTSALNSDGAVALGNSVLGALGLGGTTAAGSDAAASSLLAATTGTPFTVAGSVAPAVANASLGATGAGVAGSVGAADLGAAGAGSLGSALGATGAGALGAGLAGGLGLGGAVGAATAGGLAAGGAALGGLGGAIAGDVAASTAGIAAGAGIGAGAGAAGAAGGVAAAGGIGDTLAALATALAWVVCTELASTGEMEYETYQKAAPDFITRMRLKPSAVRGYHYWAVPYTRLMRRKDWLGKLARACMRPIANGRAALINGKPNFWGYVTFIVIEPICTMLGNTVARKSQNWKSLYSQNQEK
jgi:hypothetical protein